MIFKVQYDGITEFVQAQSQAHLLASYRSEYDVTDFDSITEISKEEAQEIMLINTDYDPDSPGDMPEEISVYDSVSGDDFLIVGSSEWL